MQNIASNEKYFRGGVGGAFGVETGDIPDRLERAGSAPVMLFMNSRCGGHGGISAFPLTFIVRRERVIICKERRGRCSSEILKLRRMGIHLTQVTQSNCGLSFHQNARIRNKGRYPSGAKEAAEKVRTKSEFGKGWIGRG